MKKKELLKLQKEFPHDRVIQRMVEAEFRENQSFKYPEEYIVKDHDEQGLIQMKHPESDRWEMEEIDERAEKKRNEFDALEKNRLYEQK